MCWIILMLFLISCRDEDLKDITDIDINQCMINYIENFDKIPNQGNDFQWDSINYQVYGWNPSTIPDYVTHEQKFIHIIKAYSFEENSAYIRKELDIEIPDWEFTQNGVINLGSSLDPMQYSNLEYIRLQTGIYPNPTAETGIAFRNNLWPTDERGNKGIIEITNYSVDNLLVNISNLEIFAQTADPAKYSPTKLSISTKFLIKRKN